MSAVPPRARAVRVLGHLLAASHPEPTVAVTAFSVALAIASGRSGAGVVAVAAAVAAGQLSVGWSNDWIDVERDVASGRRDKPVARGLLGRRTVATAAVVAAGACVPLSLLSGWRAGLAHLAAVAMAWGYNARLKATAVSFVPYAVSFCLLVVFISRGLPGSPWPPWWAMVGAAALGTGAHLANVLPDLDDDVAAGVRGLPHRLGRRRSAAGAAVLLLGASAVLAVGPGHLHPLEGVGLAAAVLLVGIGLLRRGDQRSRTPFRLTMAVAALDVAMLVAEGHLLR